LVAADNEDMAKIIAKRHTKHPITLIEDYLLNNEVLFSTFRTQINYKLKGKIDNWGEWRTPMTP